jgi:proteasome lid subunit RPN8/RPN11
MTDCPGEPHIARTDPLPPRLITISGQAEHELTQDVHQRQSIEACGLLLGRADGAGWYVSRVRPLRNIYNSPVYFEFAPEDLLEAELALQGELIGVYHSHPTGLSRASSTDRANMRRVNVEQQIPWIWLIVCGPFQRRRGREDQHLAAVAYIHDAGLGLRSLSIQFARSE